MFLQRRYTVGQHAYEKMIKLLTIREMQITATMRYFSQTINAGEGVERREPSCTVGGKVTCYSHYGEQYGRSSKIIIIIKLPCDPAITLLGKYPEKNMIQNDTCTLIHCSSIYNSQDMDAD